MADIDKAAVVAYVKEAIQNQKLGKEIKPERKGKKVGIRLNKGFVQYKWCFLR